MKKPPIHVCWIDRITREISLQGSLTGDQRQSLLAIAEKCPVHRTLHAEALAALDEALDALIATRDREGEQLARMVRDGVRGVDVVEPELERGATQRDVIRDANLVPRLQQ